LGVLAGLVVGGAAALTLMLTLSTPAAIAFGVLLVFTLIFTAYGGEHIVVAAKSGPE